MAVEQDDEVMEAYLEGNEPDTATLKKLIRKGTLNFSFVPVLCGSAFKNKGVQPLLDAVVDYLPSPLDIPPVEGIKPDSEEPDTRAPSDDARQSSDRRQRGERQEMSIEGKWRMTEMDLWDQEDRRSR